MKIIINSMLKQMKRGFAYKKSIKKQLVHTQSDVKNPYPKSKVVYRAQNTFHSID